MIDVYVKKETSCPLDEDVLKHCLCGELQKHLKKEKYLAGIVIFGKKKMMKLAKDFLSEDNTLHNVLTFSDNEKKGEFATPKSDSMYLGEVFLCWPKIKEEAVAEGITAQEKALELVRHGALHLLGIHHK